MMYTSQQRLTPPLHDALPISVPGTGRRVHLYRTARLDRRQNGGMDRRRQQHAVFLVAGWTGVRLPCQRIDAQGLRNRFGVRKSTRMKSNTLVISYAVFYLYRK